MGGVVFPSYSLASGQITGGIMVTSSKRIYAIGCHALRIAAVNALTWQQATVDPVPLLGTPKHWQASLGQSLMWSLLLSPWPHCTQYFVCALQESLFPQSCGHFVMKSRSPSKSNSLGFSVPLLDLQVGRSVVGPRTFAVVPELLWYNCSPIWDCPPCGSVVGLMATSSRRTDATCHTS